MPLVIEDLYFDLRGRKCQNFRHISLSFKVFTILCMFGIICQVHFAVAFSSVSNSAFLFPMGQVWFICTSCKVNSKSAGDLLLVPRSSILAHSGTSPTSPLHYLLVLGKVSLLPISCIAKA